MSLPLGITLDVYCLIPSNLDPIVTTEYELTFVLDGTPLNRPFTYDSLSFDTQYNVSVLSLTNLSQVSHTLTMIAAAPVITTTVQFDYAKYTWVLSIQTDESFSCIYSVDTSLLPPVANVSSISSSSNISPTPTTPLFSFTPPLSFTSSSNSTTTTTTPFHHHTATSSSTDLPTTKKHANLAALIGSTIGGILFLVLSLALIFYYRRYKHRIRQRFFNHNKMRVDPFYSLGADQQGPLVPYNRPFIDPPAKNALWNPSNVMQEAEDPRAVKRAAAAEMQRLEESRISQQEVAEPSSSRAYWLIDGSASRTSLIAHRGTPKDKKESPREEGKQCD